VIVEGDARGASRRRLARDVRGAIMGGMSKPLPTWRQLHPGEDPRVEAMQLQRFRDASPAEKMRAFTALNRQARMVALAGLRMRHPGASPEELRRRLADLLLGPELARRAYGEAPYAAAATGSDGAARR